MASFRLLSSIYVLFATWPVHAVQIPEMGPPQITRPWDERNWWAIKPSMPPKVKFGFKHDPSFSAMENLETEWADKLGKGIPVFVVRRINFQKPLSFSYMFPSGEQGQQQVYDQGVLEPYLSFNFIKDVKQCCQQGNGHVLDIGAKYGWYSLMAASFGCQVDAYEPVPWFASLMAYNIMENNNNGTGSRITLHNGKFLGNSSKNSVTRLVLPTEGNGKMNAQDGVGEHDCEHGAGAVCHDVATRTIDEELQDSEEYEGCAMKVDAEGTEPEIFAGASNYMRSHMPKIVIIELWRRMLKDTKSSDSPNIELFEKLTKMGYIPHLLMWDTVRTHNLNVAQGDIKSKEFKKTPKDLVKECTVNCIVYLKRSW